MELQERLAKLIKQPRENEWLAFKRNYHSDEEIGYTISALSNAAACIQDRNFGYLVFGVEDETHRVVGTTFKAKTAKVGKGKEDLTHWLAQRLQPRIDFEVREFDYNGKHISMYIIPATVNQPVEFIKHAYIRVGSNTRKLNEFPEKARKIWQGEHVRKFERRIAIEDVQAGRIVELLDTQSYFKLLDLPYPSDIKGVLSKFTSEGIVIETHRDYYSITNLGAILFSKDLSAFSNLWRKPVRIITYKGKDKLQTIREHIDKRGYAVGFKDLIDWTNSQLPANEIIGKALRKEVTMYPEIAIRELIANALIHQDFGESGFPLVEIYSDRIEISNPGSPLIHPDRFIDGYQSRNEKLADLLRRLRICEERGSGIDKVIHSIERFQLPAADFITQERRTKAVLYAYRQLRDMNKREKIRATYQHCCLRYTANDKMTNQSLRHRFGIEERNAASASMIIGHALQAGVIKKDDPTNKSKKYAAYIPSWA